MLVEEDNYEHFNNETINELSKLKYKFNLYDRFITVKDENGNFFKAQTPFLKVLKPIHNTFNKKKTIAKKYIILETNDELDFNNQVGQFMFIINKVHEISQEKIRDNSLEWFNTEFDDIGLDIKVKRPIDQQKDSEFIKISIPEHLVEEVEKVNKGNYLLCNIIFKGLKVSTDYIMEEWELNNFMTQEKYEELNSDHDFLEKDLKNIQIEDILQEKLENEIDECDNQEKSEILDNCKEIIFENNCDDLNKCNVDDYNEILNSNEDNIKDDGKKTFTEENTESSNKDIKHIDLKKTSKTTKKNSSNISVVSENKLKRIKNLKKSKEVIKKTPKRLVFN
jgi:hypothetical protein